MIKKLNNHVKINYIMNICRLNLFLAQNLAISRRKADQLIVEKKITINNRLAVLGDKINPQQDTIHVQGKKITNQLNRTLCYYAFNKPVGVVSSANDELGRKTVIDFFKTSHPNTYLFLVGRLDKDSEGLLLITNDGQLAYKITHPKYQIKKTYYVEASGILTSQSQQRLRTGVKLKEEQLFPAEVQVISQNHERVALTIAITEGKYHQVRRMCKAVNLEVNLLKRISIGSLSLGKLKAGQWRKLTNREIENLHQDVGQSSSVMAQQTAI